MFLYDALAANEFRVVVLLPGAEDEPIRCELQKVMLTDHPLFEAVSYVWGDAGTSARIKLGGWSRTVTKSVEAILRHMRLPSEPRRLWIDQLCVNQSKLAEKTAQVQMMRDIYTECTRCLVWLGEIAEHVQLVDAKGAIALFEYVAGFHLAGQHSARELPDCMAGHEPIKAALRALRTISPSSCQWWHRVWTLQEAKLPRKVIFVWGSLSFSKETALSAFSGFSNLERIWRTLDIDENVAQCLSTDEDFYLLLVRVLWIGPPGKAQSTPHDMVIKWWNRVATDPRDNVYALTGMYSPEQLPRSSRCDYSLDARDVFIDFTLDLMYTSLTHVPLERPSLFPLLLTHRQPAASELGLPRWVIDMRAGPRDDKGLWRLFYSWEHECYAANDGLPDIGRPECRFGSLQLSGIMVDTVQITGAVAQSSPRPALLSWWRLYADLGCQHELKSPSHTDPGSCKQYRDFCQLLLGDWHASYLGKPTLKTDGKNRRHASEYLQSGINQDAVRQRIAEQVADRRLFITKRGLIGLGHPETQTGDEVWIFNHGRVSFTLRPSDDMGNYVDSPPEDYDFLGHCYVQGLMQGFGSDKTRDDVTPEQRQVNLY